MSTDVEPRHAPANDDEARFVEVYQRYSRHIQAYCARRTQSSQVPDAVAEVFLVAWRRIEQIPEGDAVLPWLYAVAYRVISRHWRNKARTRRLIERLGGLAPEVEPLQPDVVLLQNEEFRVVLTAASRLRPIDQEILRLTLWEELPPADVSLVLGIATTAVNERAHRARRNLAKEYWKLTGDRRSPADGRGGES
jgi:RNA polymerase sigma-70 factor (ECF subfamily)